MTDLTVIPGRRVDDAEAEVVRDSEQVADRLAIWLGSVSAETAPPLSVAEPDPDEIPE